MGKINKETMERIDYTVKAIATIQKLKSNQGSIICPKCKGSLSFSKAKNGHIWGKCRTKDCLSWVQ